MEGNAIKNSGLPLEDYENILGYSITRKEVASCVKQIKMWIDSDGSVRYFGCVNPYSVEVARNDKFFDTALKNADLLVPDGVGVVIATKILGGSIRQRITGTDIFLGVCSELQDMGVARYGGRVLILDKTSPKLHRMMSYIVHSTP